MLSDEVEQGAIGAVAVTEPGQDKDLWIARLMLNSGDNSPEPLALADIPGNGINQFLGEASATPAGARPSIMLRVPTLHGAEQLVFTGLLYSPADQEC